MNSCEKTHNTPLVTIGIPTYNSERYLKEALDSIAAQTYKNIEVVISDNSSTDSTYLIINEYVSRYGWKSYRNSNNIGAGPNFNKLVDLASGKYLAIYHADDVYEPTIIEESVRVLESDSTIALVGTLAYEIDNIGRIIKQYKLPPAISGGNKSIYNFEESFYGVLESNRKHIFFVTPSIMVKREVYQDLGKFLIGGKFRSAGDYEMWLRIARNHPISIINKLLMKYRIHENQGSEKEIRTNLELPDLNAVIKENITWVKNKKLKDKAKCYINKKILITGLKQNSRRDFCKSSETFNGLKEHYKFIVRVINLLNEHKISVNFGAVKLLYRTLKSS